MYEPYTDLYKSNVVLGRNYKKIWEQVEEAIRNLYLQKEPLLSKASGHYRSTFNFFEMVRIDFVIDDNLNVYLLEVMLC